MLKKCGSLCSWTSNLDNCIESRLSLFADTSKSVANPLIISHNGASGDFPGCTLSSYAAAINDGADYIDCTVQISSDGVPFCREDVDLLKSTNVVGNQVLYQQYYDSQPELQPSPGVFAFNLTWSEVLTLKGKPISCRSSRYSGFLRWFFSGSSNLLGKVNVGVCSLAQ